MTACGRDAVVMVVAEDHDRLQPPPSGAAVVEALQRSPLREVEIERLPVVAPVREVELLPTGDETALNSDAPARNETAPLPGAGLLIAR